jgi:hypothetical protein
MTVAAMTVELILTQPSSHPIRRLRAGGCGDGVVVAVVVVTVDVAAVVVVTGVVVTVVVMAVV